MAITFHTDLKPAPQLIVLAPIVLDSSKTTHQIWDVASTAGVDVLLLGMVKDEADRMFLRRELMIMSTMLQGGKVHTNIEVEVGKNWMDVIKRHYKPGNMIACFADQRTGLFHKPLSQIVESDLNIPVYIFSELSSKPSNPAKPAQIIVWVGFIMLIIGFGILQAKLSQLPNDWFQSVLFILLTIIELWLIWVWNGLFS